MPWGEDEEAALYACVEARLLGLPIAADGLFLQMDKWIAFIYAAVLDELLALRYARVTMTVAPSMTIRFHWRASLRKALVFS